MRPDLGSLLPPPWGPFLHELDDSLTQPIELHCLGGFVLRVLYARPVETRDIDYIAVLPREELVNLQEIAGPESGLAAKHKVYLQFVSVAEVPENYESRLTEICPGEFSQIRLLALDPHDIVLIKLTRNYPIDRRDVEFLARKGILNPAILRERYQKELRPYLANVDRHDLTLRLWLEDYFSR